MTSHLFNMLICHLMDCLCLLYTVKRKPLKTCHSWVFIKLELEALLETPGSAACYLLEW